VYSILQSFLTFLPKPYQIEYFDEQHKQRANIERILKMNGKKQFEDMFDI
jgi:hypothetical protein